MPGQRLERATERAGGLDLTEFEDELEEVPEPVFARHMANGIRVPLTSEERAAIQRIAATRGVAEATLIREWVKEKLHP